MELYNNITQHTNTINVVISCSDNNVEDLLQYEHKIFQYLKK